MVQCLDFLCLLRLVRFFSRNKPKIIMYHRVTSVSGVSAIRPEVFERQLQYISSNFRVITAAQLVYEVAENCLKPNTLVLTFDDGYGDFYSVVWPLLKKYGLAASIYIATGFIDKAYWLWPDLLRYVIGETRLEKANLDNIGSVSFSGSSVQYTWNKLADYCLSLNVAERDEFIRDLAELLQVELPLEPAEPFEPLSWKQLTEMNNEGLDIGSHTVSHPILSSLDRVALRIELEHSKLRIEEQLGFSPKGICYPNGMLGDVSALVEEMSELFYDYGLMAYPGVIDSSSLMRLRRLPAPHSVAAFKLAVSGYL